LTGVLVIFGSDSDKDVFEPLMEKLKEKGIKARLEVCSAHREPEKLVGILEKAKEELVIAGAGLSAALPGFVASHSDKLVLGMPVSANYHGLDALLSIHQMPKGFAVLGLGVEAIDEAANAAEKILKGRKKIVIVNAELGEEAGKRMEACRKKLDELGLKYKLSEEDSYKDKDAVYIDFIEVGEVEAVDSEGQVVIFVPIKKESDKQDALKLASLASKGLWVGLGRGENAALCASKIVKGGK
jgi:5-(carboxyamino)imidazole ribonucleotide mutase